MNYAYARFLILTVLTTLAVFFTLRGMFTFRSKTESPFWGWLRLVFAAVLALFLLVVVKVEWLLSLVGFSK